MVYTKIIYGYEILSEDVDCLFPQTKYPDLYENDDQIEDIKLFDKLYKIMGDCAPYEKISVLLTDFEFNTSYYEGNKTRGEQKLIIGMEISKIDVHYSGSMSIPEVSDEDKDLVLKSINFNFKYLIPGLHAYVCSEL